LKEGEEMRQNDVKPKEETAKDKTESKVETKDIIAPVTIGIMKSSTIICFHLLMVQLKYGFLIVCVNGAFFSLEIFLLAH
jgi:hypothetical protein